MGSRWGECESRREMILSVLFLGHRYRAEEVGLLRPTTIITFLSIFLTYYQLYFSVLADCFSRHLTLILTWGECISRREMILSVLSPGHRYWREEGGLSRPHILQSISRKEHQPLL